MSYRTALHWAAKRGHRDVVKILLSNGADPSLRNKNKDVALSLCSNPEVRQLLISDSEDSLALDVPSETKLPIVPNYLKHPPLADRVDLPEIRQNPSRALQEKASIVERVPPLPEGIKGY